MKVLLLSALLACVAVFGIAWSQEPLRSVAAKMEGNRFKVRTYERTPLTLYVINDLEGEGCWLLVESPRGMAVASTDLGVCHDTERE